MKKFLLFVAVMMTAVCGVYAQTEISATQLTVPGETTIEGYKVDIQKNTGATSPALNSGTNVRIYAKGSLTVSGEKISKIVIDLASSVNKQYAAFTPNIGKIEPAQAKGDTQITWVGDASSVTFTVSDKADYGTSTTSAGQIHFTKITIYSDGGDEPGGPTAVSLTFPQANYTATLGEAFEAPELICTPAEALSTVVYTSSNEAVATVDETTGEVEIISAGKTEISAAIPQGNETYTSNTATYTLTVKDPSASGEESYTIEFKANGSDSGTALTAATFAKQVESGAQYVASYSDIANVYAGISGLKFSSAKNNGAVTINLSEAGKVNATSIIVNAAQFGSDTSTLSVNGSTAQSISSSDLTDYEFTISDPTELSAIKLTASKRLYVKSITVVYGKKANKVEISSEVTDENNAKVTLTYADPEATIYYGFAEDAITNVYTGPFVVEEDCTVYSFAQKDGVNSPIASQTFKLFKSFKDILSKSEAKEHLTINGNFSVLGQSGNYLMLTDGENNLMVYGCATTYEQGTAISSLSGSVTFYNSLLEITEATLTEGGEGATYNVAEKTTLEGLNYTDNLFDQYTLLAATISNKKSTGTVATATITLLETETITLYNAFGITFNNGSNFNITGFIWRNGDVMEFVPTEIVEGEPIHMVEIPVITPNKKELQVDDEITITCATEAATIYYTLDESEPTQESTRYTGPFHFEGTDFTVKARAYYEGMDKVMLPSEIAEKTYHVFNPYCNVITTHNHDVPSMATYYKHTCTVDGVDYQMYGAHDRVKGIQMKNQKETSSQAGRFCYIVQTGDNEGLALESIEVDFNTAPDGKEAIAVYGSNVPYDVFGSAEYDSEKESESIDGNGDLIGFIDGENTSVVFERDYNYFAFFPDDYANAKAIYMNSITVNYRDPMPANENEVPVIGENFLIMSDREGSLTTEDLPTHPNWNAKYTLNGSEPMDVSEGNIEHEQGIDAATLHTIEIWYEHYYLGVKSTSQTFYHLTQPNFAFYEDKVNKKTVVNFTAIGEGVKVYFTLNGNKPEVAENGPANIIRRAGANGSTYVIDSTEDLSKTHVVTSDTKTVEIKHGIITNKDDNYVFTAQAVHDNGMSSDITEDDQVPTSIVEVNAAGSPDSQAVYDLQGRKVVAPKRGIYISNGVKRVY